MYVLFPFLIVTDLSATLVACLFVNWWAPIFAYERQYSDRGASKVGYKLPNWLAWADTFDADLDQGVRDGTVTGASAYWNRVKWLYRNPAYGFSYWAIGARFTSADWTVLRYINTPERLLFIAKTASGLFNVHASLFGLRFKLGWKAWNYYDAATGQWNPQPWGPEYRVPFVFSVSRFN